MSKSMNFVRSISLLALFVGIGFTATAEVANAAMCCATDGQSCCGGPCCSAGSDWCVAFKCGITPQTGG